MIGSVIGADHLSRMPPEYNASLVMLLFFTTEG
jgi:hypothetical protein